MAVVLVKLLGGSFTTQLGSQNTHLIVQYAAGDKFKGAAQRNVVPVTLPWLLDTALKGQL